jgi:hypothetical protein
VQAIVTALQWHVAEQAFWATQTPHVRLWAEQINGFDRGDGNFQAIARIKNGSQVTLFNGEVSGQVGVAPRSAVGIPWESLKPLDTLVLGPEDVANEILDASNVPQSEFDSIKAQQSVIVLGLKITFRDGGGGVHNRYVCTYFYYARGRLNPDACRTPTQS